MNKSIFTLYYQTNIISDPTKWMSLFLIVPLLAFHCYFLDLLAKESLRFPYEASLPYFVLLLLRGLFALRARLLFALRFAVIFVLCVLIAESFEIAECRFLCWFIFNLLINYFLFLLPFRNFIYNKCKLIPNYLNFKCFKI